MTTARALGVVGMDRSPRDRAQGFFNETRLIQGVGMNRDLCIRLIGNGQARINRLGCRAPVFMKLKSTGAGFDLLNQRLSVTRVSLTKKTEIHRLTLDRTHHHFHIEGSWCAGRSIGTRRRTRTSPHHGRYSGRECLINLLGTDKMDMRVDTTGR